MKYVNCFVVGVLKGVIEKEGRNGKKYYIIQLEQTSEKGYVSIVNIFGNAEPKGSINEQIELACSVSVSDRGTLNLNYWA